MKTMHFKKRWKEQNGFTLVEVIVVLVVLAVLAAILIPALTGYIDKAQEKSAIAQCRAAVNAAQTISSENYNKGEAVSTTAVLGLAELNGSISDMEFDEDSAALLHLTYTPENINYIVAYCRYPETCGLHKQTYNVNITESPIADNWEQNKTYVIGDIVVSGDYVFRCVSPNGAGIKDPAQKSNKSWEAIDTISGTPQPYDFIIRYAEGMKVIYKDKTYQRTDYSPTSGGTPSSTSKYWTLVE